MLTPSAGQDDVNTFVTLNDIDGLNYKRRVSTYLAGTILSCFSNFLLIFALVRPDGLLTLCHGLQQLIACAQSVRPSLCLTPSFAGI